MSLNPISIATRGYVCGGCPRPIPIATQGYVCVAGAPPIRPHDRFFEARDYLAQARAEDDELLLICRALIERICKCR